MHELKIIQDVFPLLENVAKENNLKSINKVVLGVGKLRQVQSDFLKFAFEIIAKGTIAEGAELVINLIPITIFCSFCDKKFDLSEHVYACPECDSVAIEVLTGKEIIIESIDGESAKF